MDFPTSPVTPTHINTYSRWINSVAHRGSIGPGVPASVTWGTANAAVFYPMFLPWPYFAQRAFWVNGSSAAGNSDIGVYTPGGAQLWHSGSTANSGASSPQYVTISGGLLLLPGPYFLAYANDGTTNRAFGSTAATTIGRIAGWLSQLSALPLPASATFATFTASAGALTIAGLTKTASGF